MSEQFNKSQSNDDILLNTFLINKKRHHVLLHHNEIIWEKESSKEEKTTIPLTDIITVKIKSSSSTTSLNGNFASLFSLNSNSNYNYNRNASTDTLNSIAPSVTTANIADTITNTSSTTSIASNNMTSSDNIDENHCNLLYIYYAKRLKNSRKRYNQWRKSTKILFNKDRKIIKQWYEAINKLLEAQKRPKYILMFINPYGGKKQGLQIYEKLAKPLFNLANVEISCIVSQRHNQIRDMIMAQSLDIYDAICCVGGDGTFAEVFNGLIFRAIRDLNMDQNQPDYIPKPKLPIGIIPAGSTNTVVYCMHGTTDIRTAVIHIILGQTRGLDLSSFCNNNGLVRFYASVMSYGYLGDVALESEKFRWMGPKRYDYSGFKKIILNNGYQGEITYLVQQPDDKELQSESPVKSALNTKCTVDCVYCSQTMNENRNCKSTSSVSSSSSPSQVSNYQSSSPVKESQCSVISDGKEWKNIKGVFFMISSANICCASSRSLNGLSPYCHLGDGYVDIVLVRHTNFINNIRLLLTLVNRRGDIANLPFVEIHRTRKFYFRGNKLVNNEQNSGINSGSCQPINNSLDNSSNKTSQWNCDGEVMHDCNIFISSHCQLIDVFMRGPYTETNKGNSNKCINFCRT